MHLLGKQEIEGSNPFTVFQEVKILSENQTVYQNVGLYSTQKRKFMLRMPEFDFNNAEHIATAKKIANDLKGSIYVVREFVVEDSLYQEEAPQKIAKDWYVLEVKPDN